MSTAMGKFLLKPKYMWFQRKRVLLKPNILVSTDFWFKQKTWVLSAKVFHSILSYRVLRRLCCGSITEWPHTEACLQLLSLSALQFTRCGAVRHWSHTEA